MFNFKNLSWHDLINDKSIILVDLDDNLHKKYNAKVIKYDNNKNVLIRYLDNPFIKDKYWWKGGEKPGLNPLSYRAKFLGDDVDDMEGLIEEDFQEDGYDDIINYDKESYRFYKTISNYPFLNGVQGNVHVHKYYTSLFINEVTQGIIPYCIKENIKDKIVDKLIEYNEPIKCIMDNLPFDYSPEIRDYHKYKGNQLAENDFTKIFKQNLSYLITNQFIKKYISDIKLNENQIEKIKKDMKNGYKNIDMIKLIPYIIKYNIIIFIINDDYTDYVIEKLGDNYDKNIYIMKKDNHWYSIV